MMYLSYYGLETNPFVDKFNKDKAYLSSNYNNMYFRLKYLEEIKAIGLPEQLAALDRPNGYLDILRGWSVGTKLEKSNNITIPKYTGTFTYEYAREVE